MAHALSSVRFGSRESGEPIPQPHRIELIDGKHSDAALCASPAAGQPRSALSRRLGERGIHDLDEFLILCNPGARRHTIKHTGRDVIRLLIIGFGNPLRSDDGFGWYVAQELARTIKHPGIRVIAAHQLMPEMADEARRAQQVVFIDAARDGNPGTVKCTTIKPDQAPVNFSHHLSPAAILRLTADLYDQRPAAQLLTVTGERFELGESMSPSVTAALPQVMAQIRSLVEEITEESESSSRRH